MIIPNIDDLNGMQCTEKYFKFHYPEFLQFLNEKYSYIKFSEKLYWYIHGLNDYPKCPICGRKTKFINCKEGYRMYCCRKCLNSDPNKKEKTKQTNIKKYGGIAPACSQKVINKFKQTCLERYGVENPMQNIDIKTKSRNSNIKRHGGCGNASIKLKNKYITTVQQNNIIGHKHLIGYAKNGDWICKCPHPECDKCLEKSYIINHNIYNQRFRYGTELCTNLYPIDNNRCKNTSIELFVQNLLNEYNIEYKTNVRNIIPSKELDIYIPSKNIAIECNGTYSHCSKYKPIKYHINKYKECKEKGIQLISIWEDWIRNKPEIVKSIILSKLGLINKFIYARKCTIKEVNSKICNDFLDKNHIQGRSASKINIGLYYNNELVSVMTFSSPRINMGARNHKQQWELVRFCSKLNSRIIGGASKLLNFFIKNYNPISIVSFSMNDISNGSLYETLKFKCNDKITNSYWYIEPNTFRRYHRVSFSKQAIVKRGWKDKIDNTWTEFEVMREHGYFQIYDSGQLKWILNLK